MKLFKRIFCLFVGVTFLFFAAACSLLDDDEATSQTGAEATPESFTLPEPLATLGANMVKSQACLVKTLPVIQTKTVQGDLLAWSPLTDELAFVEPDNKDWGWLVGNLAIYNLAQDKTIFESQNQAIFGDLTWSPEGDYLAYVTLDQKEKVYNVRLSALSDNSTVDVFSSSSNARTDDWASLKGIRKWDNTGNLQVSSSCGMDCVQFYDFNTQSMSLTQQEQGRKKDDDSLVIQNESDSPDGKWQITVDNDKNNWLSSTEKNEASLFLERTDTDEIKWAASSNYFALRSAGQILIYEPVCSKK